MHVKILALLLATLACLAAPKESAGLAAQEPAAYYPYPVDGALLGQGWDSYLERPTTGGCVVVEERRLERSRFTSNLVETKSTSSLVESKSLAVSAAYSGFLFSASGSLDKSSSRKINADALHFLFTFEAETGSTFAVGRDTTPIMSFDDTPFKELVDATDSDTAEDILVAWRLDRPDVYAGSSVTLTTEAQKLLDQGGLDFRRRCGDGFVSAIHRGTKIDFLVTYNSSSRAEQEAFRAELASKGFGVRLSATGTGSTEAKVVDKKILISIDQEGGVPIAPPADAGQPLDRISSIYNDPSLLISSPTAYRVTVTPYSAISSHKKDLPAGLERLARHYFQLRDVYALALGALEAVEADPATGAGKIAKAMGGQAHLRVLLSHVLFDQRIVEQVVTDCYRAGAEEAAQVEHGICTEELLSDALEKIYDQYPGREEAEHYNELPEEQIVLDSNEVAWRAYWNSITTLEDAESKPSLLRDFYRRTYAYLAATPLPADADAKIETTTAEGRNALRKRIYELRLNPWKEYSCALSVRDPLCVSEPYLQRLLFGLTFDYLEFMGTPTPNESLVGDLRANNQDGQASPSQLWLSKQVLRELSPE